MTSQPLLWQIMLNDVFPIGYTGQALINLLNAHPVSF